MLNRLIGIVLAACWVAAVGCAGTSGIGGNNNAGIPCQDENDCPAGSECVSNFCVSSGDGGVPDSAAPPGAINIFPDPVQFGFAPLFIDTVQDVTIVNVGQGDLHISDITVVEDDDLDEYIATPSGPADVTLAPNEELVVSVTLNPQDAELDFGSLEVTSDDPDNPVVSVALTSEYKGTQSLELCTLDPAVPAPVEFVDCQVDAVNSDPIIDFGVVPFGSPATMVVAVRNGADGNAPLTVDDVIIDAVNPLFLPEFSLRFFEYDTDGVTELPVTFPIVMSAGDPAQGIDADVIYVEVTFSANIDGIISSTQLIFTTNDPNADPVPISAAVSGCPTDWWDINGDPADGCEYNCVFQGPEICNTGQDEDCDGNLDTEGAAGCTVYYRDDDGDNFGLDTDSRCLCSAINPYRATVGGDCDDSNSAVNPNATEICDGIDNNCAGGIDEGLGTTNCGLGICNNTINNCVGGVPQSCDPFLGQGTEVCDGSLDEDCDGQVDEMTSTDTNNCGSCGNLCTNQHGTTLCSGGNCIPTCDPGYDSCNGDPDDGCEQQLNTMTHCTACNTGCSLPNANESCASGSCQVTSCNGGWCNADGLHPNGCEFDLDTNPGCGSYTDIGSVNGDSGSNSTSWSGRGERWFRVYVAEANSGLSCTDLCIRVNLTVPTGTDYDVYGYCDNCSGSDASSTAGGSTNEQFYMRWDEDCFLGVPTGSDSGRYIYIRVTLWSGNVCTNYTLTVTGNSCSGGNTCSAR